MLNGTYARRVALHEAGHFLIAYLLGLLPRAYTLSSLDVFIKWVLAILAVLRCAVPSRCQGIVQWLPVQPLPDACAGAVLCGEPRMHAAAGSPQGR